MKCNSHSKYILGFVVFLVFSCSPKTNTVQETPPGFIGKLFDNTVSRYNAYYNSNLIYETSLNSAENGYQEDYDVLFAPSVQDEIARSGSVSGQMDEIIEKTTAMIEAKPYSKWVDDHFLINGIAHYIKGDYEMAERIFRYVGSEYQSGVQYDRVTSRQKVKGLDRAEQARDEAKERLKEVEEIREEREKEAEEAEKERRLTAKERAKEAKRLKKRNKKLKKEAEKEFDDRREEGRDAIAEEIVKEIKEREEDVQKKRANISDADRELLATAPTLKFDEGFQKEGLLAHEVAAKDAMLWLAKTYITTEQFLSAQAVLTAINEDEFFPERLNTDYYLTYADMHIRLQNIPKAIEYVQLAADASPRRTKGRLYYLMGQLYAQDDDWENAKIAFNTVEKYQPYYDMIYHANMKVIDRSLYEGKFETEDFITPLKKMTRDAKNDDFLDEVYYYLGEAYSAKGQTEDAIEAFQSSIEYEGNSEESVKKSYVALANQYFNDKDFVNAQFNYDEALAFIDESSTEYATIAIYAESTSIINENMATIHRQDSLLALSQLSDEEQLKIIEKKVKKEMRDEFREKLESANDGFGSQNNANPNRNRGNNNRSNNIENAGFYFYDIQQSTLGYNEFKQEWGTRPNVDNWRRQSEIEKGRRRARGKQAAAYEEVEVSSEEQRIAQYLSEIPNLPTQKEDANALIFESYKKLITVFGQKLGDDELYDFYSAELQERNPPNEIMASLNETKIETSGTSTQDTTLIQQSEYEELYSLAYEAYVAKDYERALTFTTQSKTFSDKSLKAKFAFIEAMSKGMLADDETLINELITFTEQYPRSPLKDQALAIINQ